MNKALIVILATVALDAIGAGLIFPILPDLLAEVTGGGDIGMLYGTMLAVFAVMQFVFSPVLGVLSDRFGRRPVLLLSLAGTFLDYLIMALSPLGWVLVVGRALAGITSANMAVASAYITDITPPDQRAARFGTIGAIMSLGFIVGGVIVARKGLGPRPLRLILVCNLVNWLICTVFTLRSSIVMLAIGMAVWLVLIPVIEAPAIWSMAVMTIAALSTTRLATGTHAS